jgi:hypothetical protein
MTGNPKLGLLTGKSAEIHAVTPVTGLKLGRMYSFKGYGFGVGNLGHCG